LIGQGAHVGAVNSEGDTPLDIAEEEAMEELLQNEVNRQGNKKSNIKGMCTELFQNIIHDIPGKGICCHCMTVIIK
jgi:hypothetical protein